MTNDIANRGGVKRLEVFDVAKGIGIILMVVGHCCGPKLFNWIYSFHMPLFFVMSGLFFVSGKYGFREFLQKRIRQLIVPLVIFSLIIVGLSVVFIPETNPVGRLKNGFPGALWFMWALFLLELLYFAIDKVAKSNKLILLSVALFAMFFAKWLNVNAYGISSWNINTILAALPFYCWGHVYADGIKKSICNKTDFCKTSLVAFIFLLVPFLVVSYTHKTILMWNNDIPSPVLLYYLCALLGLTGIFLVAKLLGGKDNVVMKCLSFLGKNTIPVIAFNELLLDATSKYIVCESHILFKGMQQLLVWSVSLFVIWFCNRYCKWAVGKK